MRNTAGGQRRILLSATEPALCCKTASRIQYYGLYLMHIPNNITFTANASLVITQLSFELGQMAIVMYRSKETIAYRPAVPNKAHRHLLTKS